MSTKFASVMNWPARVVIQKCGKSYAKLFEPDADDSLKLLQEHWKMNSDDQVIVRGEGEGGVAMICRKSYLLRISGYFRSFVGRWNEVDSTPEIKLENIPLDVFKSLLELISTGLLEMGDHSNLTVLIGAANFLEMADLSSQFSDLIGKEMELYNSSVILWCYSTPEEYHGYVGLSEKASTFIKAKFDYILATCSEQLMEMPGKQWLDVVSDPALFVVSEDTLFRTLCRWVAVDPSKRSDDFVAMAKYIRGGCLSKNLLAEFRCDPSISLVLRMFIACINESSESQPRTMEVVAIMQYNGVGGIVYFDPFARSAGSVTLPNLFDAPCHSRYVSFVVSPANVIYILRDQFLRAFDPVLNVWTPKFGAVPPGCSFERFGLGSTAYLNGLFYMVTHDSDTEGNSYREPGTKIFKFGCFPMDTTSLEMLLLPYYLHNVRYPLLVGLAGKLHVFTGGTNHYVFDPSNVSPAEAWSAASPITPPFRHCPKTCCVGPDGMLYISGNHETTLRIFNAATSEIRISGEVNLKNPEL